VKTLVIALSACAAVALTGCGGDGDSGPTKAEFIEQADKICQEGDDKIAAAAEDFADPANPTEAEVMTAVEDVVVPSLRGQVEELRELDPPEADSEEIEAMLDALEKATEAAEADPEAVLDEGTFADANERAQEYGFESCGEAQ
jgi:hypothetical protein